MAKIVYSVEECRDKISSDCTGTFNRLVKRGRPQVNCDACKAAKVPASTRKLNAANPINVETRERICGCGATFTVKAGRGRKAEKCDDCRESGKVYRRNDEGALEEIRAETLRREQEEKKEAAGKLRAENLFMMMKPLLKNTRKREVIVH
jgi:hypothetical protein